MVDGRNGRWRCLPYFIMDMREMASLGFGSAGP